MPICPAAGMSLCVPLPKQQCWQPTETKKASLTCSKRIVADSSIFDWGSIEANFAYKLSRFRYIFTNMLFLQKKLLHNITKIDAIGKAHQPSGESHLCLV